MSDRVMKRLFAVITVFTVGCAATLECLQVEGPSRTAFVLDHGRHTSLVVENDRGVLHRYSYGERRWYAESEVGFWRALGAGFTDTDAVLGRRELHTEATGDGVLRALRVGVEAVHGFRVDAGLTDELIVELDGLFFEDTGALVYNELHDLEFAPHPRPYTVWYNSNHMVAEWLGELGCRVSGSPMMSSWRVR